MLKSLYKNFFCSLVSRKKNIINLLFLPIAFFSLHGYGHNSTPLLSEKNQINFFGEITSHNVYDNKAVEFTCAVSSPEKDAVSIQLSFPSVDVVKVQIGHEKTDGIEKEGVPFIFSEQDDEFRIKTDSLWVTLKKSSWQLSIYRANWELVYSEQERQSGLMLNENQKVYIAANMEPDEHFYGFGEKFNGFDQRGNEVVMELDDAFASTDGKTYKSIPFFISSRQYSLLVNSAKRVIFHMGDVSETGYSFENPGEKLEYFIFTNRNPLKAISQYTSITGRSPLIPRWSLEPWLSRRRITGWSDVGTAEMDIDMILNDGYRLGVILWEGIRNLFKGDQSARLHRLSDKWHGLGIKQVFWGQEGHIPLKGISEEKVNKNYFILRDDSSYCIGKRYGGSVYIDPTNPEAMDWWKNRFYRHALTGKDGKSKPGHWNMDGIKIDFCDFFPKDDSNLLMNVDTEGMHNLHPVFFSEQIYDWLQQIKPDGGITWVRGGGLGLQRVGYSWGGDRLRNFSQLKGTVSASLGVSVCGVSLIGHDLGGYWGGDSPDSRETYIRGVQYATFSPAFHDHGSAPGPWEQDEYGRENYRFYSRVRYNILPYIYHYVRVSHEEGIPIMRGLFLHHPNDANTYTIEDEYYLGNEMLIAPFVHEGYKREVYLPKGKWIDFWTQESYNGRKNMTYSAALNRIPVFVKESSVIPLQLNNQLEIGGLFPQEEKNDLLPAFRIFKGDNAKFSFYDENQVHIEKSTHNSLLNIKVSGIGEPFGILIDGILPESVSVNNTEIESIEKQLFSKAIQGWRYDSVQNQSLIKIESIPGIENYEIVAENIVEINKNSDDDHASSISPPVIEQVVGWNQSIDVSFQSVKSADSYIIEYWKESDADKNEIRVTDSPATIVGLANGEKYKLVIYSVDGDSQSAESSVVSAIPEKRNAFFRSGQGQIFINAEHSLSKENLVDGGSKNIYGVYSKQDADYTVWVKACKNINHHLYYRWYKAGSAVMQKGLNYVEINKVDPKTEIKRINLSSGESDRPILKDETENAFVEKKKFKVKNQTAIDFQ